MKKTDKYSYEPVDLPQRKPKPAFIDLVNARFKKTALDMVGIIALMMEGPCRLLCINLIDPSRVLRRRKKFCKRMFKIEAKRIKRFKKYNVVRFTKPVIGSDWGEENNS